MGASKVRSLLAEAAASKSASVQDEDFDRAARSKHAVDELTELHERCKRLELIKAESLFLEEYEAAGEAKAELDRLVAEAEAHFRQIDHPEAGGKAPGGGKAGSGKAGGGKAGD